MLCSEVLAGEREMYPGGWGHQTGDVMLLPSPILLRERCVVEVPPSLHTLGLP